MTYLVLGFSLLLFWGAWGLGLALWFLPPGWRRYLWSVCLPFGISFQIAVVWWIAMAGGTVERYGPWMNLLPALLLITALLQRARRRWLIQSLRTRMCRVSALMAVAAAAYALMPAAVSKYHPGELTTFSFGSCDAPDYVMGARLFLEKGRDAQGGFWSQPEVHQFADGLTFWNNLRKTSHHGPAALLVSTADRFHLPLYRMADGLTFWTYWTRLNHFGPAALLAITAATLQVPLWQLGTVLAAALGAAAVPLVLAFARFVLRFTWLYAASIAFLYLFSPLWLYGAYHVALGQLIGAAAAGGCLLLGCHVPRWRHKTDKLKAVFAGTVVLWLLLSSYAFMIVFVAFVVVAVAFWHALLKRNVWSFLHVMRGVAATLLMCTLLFPTRVWGFVLSVLFFGGVTAGWPIGPMQVQTVVGLPADSSLNPLEADAALPLSLAFGALWLWGFLNSWRRRDPALPIVGITTLFVFGFTYGLIEADPADTHLNSYKAYKLVAVFLPALLPSLFVGFKYPVLRVQRYVIAGLLVMIAMFLPRPLSEMWKAAEFMPLRVTERFAEMSQEEKNPGIQGVNIVSERTWTRLWVSAFLAEKRQFFADSTYVSRGSVPLEGDWTAEDDLHGIYPAGAKRFGNRVVLRRATDAALVGVFFGPGWWQDEEAHRWSGAAGRDFVLQIDSQTPLKVDLEMDGVFKVPGTKLRAFRGSNEIKVAQQDGHIKVSGIELAVGQTELRFKANQFPEPSRNKRDPRSFLYKLTGVAVTKSEEP